MGLFSSNNDNSERPDMTVRSTRKVCWEARDNFFACLDKHNIEDAIKHSKEATDKCGKEEQVFEQDCIKTWVEYFKQRRVNEREKERQLKALEDRGAIKLDTTTTFK